MEGSYYFVPYAWVCGVSACEVVVEDVEDEVASECHEDDADSCEVELGGLFFDYRKGCD